MSRIIIISNRLPVSITEKDNELEIVPSSGGLATGLSGILDSDNSLWMGWPGMEVPEEQEAHIKEQLSNYQLHPVFLSQQEISGFYEGFSNNTIWPLFHYFPKLTSFEQENWEMYVNVNRKFAAELCKVVESSDIIWIHDYHLFLLPELIREKFPDIAIGYFQHIPFPSYEIFRILPWREQMLKGLLGADLLGFHTYDDCRHFVSSSCRILGLSADHNRLHFRNRSVMVDTFPMGIDYDRYDQHARSKKTTERLRGLRDTLGKTRMILSVDRLDISKGIPEKLKTFETFLDRYPQYIAKCSLILLVVPSRIGVRNYQVLKEEIEREVGRINGKYGRIAWTPIHYIYRSIDSDHLAAFYRISDIALITPLRDGMNLVAKEYIASQVDKEGVLILSEMAGASKELPDAVIVNPYDHVRVADEIHRALTLPETERAHKNAILKLRLKRYDVKKWANEYIQQLQQAVMGRDTLQSNVPYLDLSELEHLVSGRQQRLIFLDYDGTLVPFHNEPSKAVPDAELLSLIEQVATAPQNKVVIITGRNKTEIGEWFQNTSVDIIAEHGAWVRYHGSTEWICSVQEERGWKEEYKNFFMKYCDNTSGSFVEEKDFSLVWHYRKVDPELAITRVREFVSNLEFRIANKNLSILEGNKVVELKVAGINKGTAAGQYAMHCPHDWIFAAGDDKTDEYLFDELPAEATTVKIGHQLTKARYHLNDLNELRQALKLFTR